MRITKADREAIIADAKCLQTYIGVYIDTLNEAEDLLDLCRDRLLRIEYALARVREGKPTGRDA